MGDKVYVWSAWVTKKPKGWYEILWDAHDSYYGGGMMKYIDKRQINPIWLDFGSVEGAEIQREERIQFLKKLAVSSTKLIPVQVFISQVRY